MLYCYARNGRTITNSPILQHAIQDPNLPIGHFFLDMVNLDIPRLDLYSQLHVHPPTHIISLQMGESKKTHHLALPLTHPRQRLPPQGSNLLSFPPRTNRKNMALDKLLQIPPCPLLALLPLIRLRLA